MIRILIFFFILSFYSSASSSSLIKEKIISQLELTENLSFNFKQKINGNNENGNCIIKYQKKIYCEYNNINKKIIVSDGKSLVIKNRSNGIFYIYPLKKTPLFFLLDKNYLIEKIKISTLRNIEDKYLNYKLFENNNEINIFFDKETYNLIGWQTEDIYQNLTIMFIASIQVNQKIDENLFILPKQD
jgi:outer membrane lipoprotein-sorting protein